MANMAPDTSTLAKAILGFKGATGGQKQHEELNRHLERIHRDFLSGRKEEGDTSPGRRDASGLAFQREIPAERQHEGGGNVLSNDPQGRGKEFARDPDRAGDIAPSNRGEAYSMSSVASVRSGGHQESNLRSGPGIVGPGAVSFRTVAAKRAGDHINEPPQTSGGNRKSVNPAPSAREPARVGNVPTPGRGGPNDQNTGQYEEEPKYVGKERLGGDQYERAAEGVRKLLKAPRR